MDPDRKSVAKYQGLNDLWQDIIWKKFWLCECDWLHSRANLKETAQKLTTD